MTSTILRFILDHWKKALAASLLLTAILAVRGCYERQVELEVAEVVANERLADLKASNERAEALDKAYRVVVEETGPALARLDSLRRTAQSRHDAAESDAREASIRLAEAGDSLAATLDSLDRVVPPELKHLTGNAIRQHEEERAAQHSLVSALRQQLASTQDMLATADSTIRLQDRRYESLEGAYEARGRACEACREALEVSGQDDGWSTFHKVTAGVALLTVGYVAGAGL